MKSSHVWAIAVVLTTSLVALNLYLLSGVCAAQGGASVLGAVPSFHQNIEHSKVVPAHRPAAAKVSEQKPAAPPAAAIPPAAKGASSAPGAGFSGQVPIPGKYAYAFYVTQETYACYALVNAIRLNHLKKHPSIDTVVLHIPGAMSEAMKARFKKHGAKLIEVQTWQRPGVPGYYLHALTKLRLFSLYQYDGVMFVDSDGIWMRNLDYLFYYLDPLLVYSPRAYWIQQPFITSSFLFIRPNKAKFEELRAHVDRSSGDADMDIVNKFWCAHRDNNKAEYCGFLPGYFATLDSTMHTKVPYLLEYRDRIPYVHFTIMKPGLKYGNRPYAEQMKKDYGTHWPWIDELWEAHKVFSDLLPHCSA